MKILEIIPNLSSGGAQRFVVDLCNTLCKDNDIILITLYQTNGINGFYNDELSPNVQLISLNKHSGFDFNLSINLYKLIKQLSPDIVHSHMGAISYLALSFILLKRISFFHTIHTDAKHEAGGFINSMLRRFAFNNEYIFPITISKQSNNSFVRFYKRNTPIIYNGRNIKQNLNVSIELQHEMIEYKKSDKTKIIVCVARMEPIKRQLLLAQIAKRLLIEGMDLAILFIGHEHKFPNIAQEIKDLGCKNIHVLGEKKNVLEYLKIADAFCLFSTVEGFPISLLEAMGVGCVPICTPVGGMADLIVDGENGILSKDTSESSCYLALKSFMQLSESDYLQMKENTIKSYSPYTMDICAKKYQKMFYEKHKNIMWRNEDFENVK